MSEFTIALVGQPNCGKSTLFNVLSDIKTASSNFSGTSVEVSQSRLSARGSTFNLVDLPGAYSLNSGDEAEKVTCNYLLNQQVDIVINVVDASLLSRSLEMTVELVELGLPMIVVLNMWDEAERKGLKIYPGKLEEMFGVPVVTTSALYGKGVVKLIETTYRLLLTQPPVANVLTYTTHIEKAVVAVQQKIESVSAEFKGSSRFYAIKAIENQEVIPDRIIAAAGSDLSEICHRISTDHHEDCYETIAHERHHLAMKITEQISHFVDRKSMPLRERLDRYLLHPVGGHFFLIFYLLLFFTTIFWAGKVISSLIEIPLSYIPELYGSLIRTSPFLWHTFDGIYQGIAGAVGIVLPYFVPLSLIMAIFEDTGYLSRMAFLLDSVMHKIGLHGKSVAPFIMGFGCSVPAMYGIRIIENRRDRMLTALLVPFIPCSARTAVIFALTAAFAGPMAALGVYLVVAVVIGITGRMLTVFMGNSTSLVLEIPELRRPSFKNSLSKTWYKISAFLRFALPFLILGSVALAWLEYANLNHYFNDMFAVLLEPVLGLPRELGSTLIFGFFRKELILVMAASAMGVETISQLPLTVTQVMVFAVFVTLYFPCFSTFVVMLKEFGKKITLLSAFISVLAATVTAFTVKIILQLL